MPTTVDDILAASEFRAVYGQDRGSCFGVRDASQLRPPTMKRMSADERMADESCEDAFRAFDAGDRSLWTPIRNRHDDCALQLYTLTAHLAEGRSVCDQAAACACGTSGSLGTLIGDHTELEFLPKE